MRRNDSHRIGLVSDCPLTLFDLKALLAQSDYQVVIAISLQRLDAQDLVKNRVDTWFVSLSPSGDSSDALSVLFDVDVPMLIDEAMDRSVVRCTRDADSWRARVLDKLNGAALVTAADGHSLEPERACPWPETHQGARNLWVLGASLGGPEALLSFLSHVPADLPASFVYAQHIDEYCSEMLCEVMSRRTELTVSSLGHGDVLRHGQLGIVPVATALEFKSMGKVVGTGERWSGPFAPSITQIAQQVAAIYRQAAGLIVFSGMGDDGASACPDIKRWGGAVWVQEPSSCICSAMPEAALATSCVDLVAEPSALAQALIDYY